MFQIYQSSIVKIRIIGIVLVEISTSGCSTNDQGENHGGSVQCTARPDGQPGACFVLRLPVQAGPASAFTPGDPASAGGMGAAASSRA